MADGGQPSHPHSLGADVLDNPGEYKDILWFWHSKGWTGLEFQHQLIEWKSFRQWQERVRKFYIPRNRFSEYKNTIRESQDDLAYAWDIRVYEDQHKQNRLEDWNEFRSIYQKRLIEQRTVLPTKEEEAVRIWKQLEDIERGLGGHHPSTERPVENRMDVGKVIMREEKRSKDAEDRIQAAERKLHHARSECTMAKGVSIETAQEGLELAHTISWLQGRDSRARGKLRWEMKELKRWEVFVKWIDDQYPAIAAECGYSMDDSMHKRALDLPSSSKGSRSRERLPRRTSTRTPSVLRPNPSSKISKPAMRKSYRHHRAESGSSGSTQAATMQHDVEPTIASPWSGRLRQLGTDRPSRSANVTNLGPVSSSKVIKTNTKFRQTKQRESLKNLSFNARCTADSNLRPNLTPRSRSLRTKAPFGTKGSSVSELNNLRRSQRTKARK